MYPGDYPIGWISRVVLKLWDKAFENPIFHLGLGQIPGLPRFDFKSAGGVRVVRGANAFGERKPIFKEDPPGDFDFVTELGIFTEVCFKC